MWTARETVQPQADQISVRWDSEYEYTEAWAEQLGPTKWQLYARTSLPVESWSWDNGLTGASPIWEDASPPDSTVATLLTQLGDTSGLTLTLPATRDSTAQGPVLRVNGDSYSTITKARVGGATAVAAAAAAVGGQVVYPVGRVRLKKSGGALIPPRDGDWLELNGFRVTFKSSPTQHNHVLVTGDAAADFSAMVRAFSTAEDPRLPLDRLEISEPASGVMDLTGEPDDSLLDFRLSSSTRPSASGDFELFQLSASMLQARYFELEIGVSSTPIITDWRRWTGEKLEVPAPSWIGARVTRKSASVSDSRWLTVDALELLCDRAEPTVGNAVWQFTRPGENQVFTTPNSYKIWRLDGFNVVAEGVTENRTLDVQFRVSHDNARSWNQWAPLTDAALAAVPANPLGYSQVQYSVTRTGADPNGTISLLGIYLRGEFVNITCDYMRLASLGLSPCCGSGASQCGDETGSGAAQSEASGYPGDITPHADLMREFSTCDTSKLWNPYATGAATKLYQYQSQIVTQLFGHTVTWYKTTVDSNGTDVVLHEYGLFKITGQKDIKVSVPDNQFPDSTAVQMTQWTMELLDSFEIHVTKEEFKAAFGLTSRPEMNDGVFFCQTNRLYQVQHAAPYRNFMNAATFYKVVLRKWPNKENVIPATPEIAESMNRLTEYNKLDTLFGIEQKQEEDRVTKDVWQPLSRSQQRTTADGVKNSREVVTTYSDLVVSKYQFDMSGVPLGEPAVTMLSSDRLLREQDSRSISLLIKLTGTYTSRRDVASSGKWSLHLQGMQITFSVDGFGSWTLDGSRARLGTWCGIMVKYDGPRQNLEMQLYEIPAPGESMIPLKSKRFSTPAMSWDGGEPILLHGGAHLITNVRVWDVFVPSGQETRVLTEQVPRDTQHIIAQDNANPLLPTPNYGGNEAQS